MTDQPQLHSSIVSMISLASGIAAKHPDMGPQRNHLGVQA
jgi:hypothetical protein